MGYWLYYIALMFLGYALQRPWVMAGVLVFFVLRPFIPDPWVLVKTFGRIQALGAQISANPANVTARRDLAELWLERLRPRKALSLLDEARQRDPNSAELLYLTGVARLRSGDAEGALEPLIKAVEIDARIRFGEAYLAAAEALVTLGRFEEAEDAIERYVNVNSSSVQGFVWLSEVRRRRGDREGAREALREALATWSQVPGFRRRAELRWWLRAQLARLWT
jgi:tetratricopeptide (TPR) repeat protein